MFRTNTSDAFWFAVSCGLGMVGWDLAQLLRAGIGTTTRDLLSVIVATLALTAAHVLLLGAVLSIPYAFAMGNDRISTRLCSIGRWIRQRLQNQNPSSTVSTHASLLAVPFAIATFAAVAVPISIRIHDAVRVARNAAGASLLVHLGAALAAAFVYATLVGVWTALLRRLATRPPFTGWIARPWITASFIGLLSLAIAITAIVLNRRILAAVDLTWLWAILIATVSGAVVAWLRTLPNLSHKIRRIVGTSIVSLMIIFVLVAMFVWSYSNNARAMLVSHTTYGKLFNASQTAAFDWDGDGYSSFFGGNDCAPWDSSIHPGALDIPYNDIDEDCSGSDLRYDSHPPTRRWDHALPSTIKSRPHIILITVDALNPRHLGFNGYERPISANIDALATRSVRFNNAYAQGPSTRLSFPSLFTSLYDPQIKRPKQGRIPLAILPKNLMLAEIMRDAGYKTIAIVPTAYFTAWTGFTQGFQIVDDSPTRHKGPHTSEVVSDATIQQLEEAKDADKPFFLWVHYYDPHGPFDQPPGSPVFGTRSVDVYDAEVHHTDKHIGRVLKWIQDNLEARDRLLILTADHGESFDERHPIKHHGYDLHTDVLRVPLLFDIPGFTPRTVNGPVSLMDITPTLVNIARIQGSFEFEGTSLVPALLRGEGLENRFTFHTFFLPEDVKRDRDPLRLVAVRTERYNLIHDRQTNVYSLYDFTVDPVEKNNLFDSQPEVANALRSQLQLWNYRMAGGVIKIPEPASSKSP